jgi:hypothetical protein
MPAHGRYDTQNCNNILACGKALAPTKPLKCSLVLEYSKERKQLIVQLAIVDMLLAPRITHTPFTSAMHAIIAPLTAGV